MSVLVIATVLTTLPVFPVAADDEDVKKAAKLVEEAGTAYFREGQSQGSNRTGKQGYQARRQEFRGILRPRFRPTSLCGRTRTL